MRGAMFAMPDARRYCRRAAMTRYALPPVECLLPAHAHDDMRDDATTPLYGARYVARSACAARRYLRAPAACRAPR